MEAVGRRRRSTESNCWCRKGRKPKRQRTPRRAGLPAPSRATRRTAAGQCRSRPKPDPPRRPEPRAGSKPSSTDSRLFRLRMNSPHTTRSTTEPAIWAAASPLRILAAAGLRRRLAARKIARRLDAGGADGREQSISRVADNQQDGQVASVAQSSLTSRNTETRPRGARAARPRAAARPAPAPRPRQHPMTQRLDEAQPTRSHRLAPIAARIAISRPRPSPRQGRAQDVAQPMRRIPPTSIRNSAASATPWDPFCGSAGPSVRHRRVRAGRR